MSAIRADDGHPTTIGNLIRRLGFGRLAYHLYHRPRRFLRSLGLPDQQVTVPVFGYELLLPPPAKNECFTQIYRDRVWEPEVTEAIRKIVRPGMTCVDIGADVGYFVLEFCSLNGSSPVLAFEPYRPSFEILNQSLARNKLTERAWTFNMGLGASSASLYFSEVTSQLTPKPETADAAEVAIVRFDEFVKAMPNRPAKIDFVLIDVEGAEHDVLRGMEQMLKTDRPALLIEVHGPMLPGFKTSKADLLKWLKELGYRQEWIAGEALDAPGMSHGLFIPV